MMNGKFISYLKSQLGASCLQPKSMSCQIRFLHWSRCIASDIWKKNAEFVMKSSNCKNRNNTAGTLATLLCNYC